LDTHACSCTAHVAHSCMMAISFLKRPRTRRSTLFPYTTLFRSAPTMQEDGSIIERNRGTPQGGVVSPILSNLTDHTTLWGAAVRSEEHTSELQSPYELVCRLLLENKKDIRGRCIPENHCREIAA